MSDAVIIWGMVCATILVLVFGLVGIFAWIDRYTYTEIQRITKLELQMRELRERPEFKMDRTTLSGPKKPLFTLTKTQNKRRG